MIKEAIEKIAALALIAEAPQIKEVGDAVLIRTPGGFEDITAKVRAHDEHPRFKDGSFIFFDIPSFNHYLNAHKTRWTSVFGDPAARTFVAYIDGHASEYAASQSTGPVMLAGRHRHQAHFRLNTSDELNAWVRTGNNGVDQKALYEFMEDHLEDIVSPDHGDIMDMCRELSAVKTGAFSGVHRPKSGQTQITYTETTTVSQRGSETEIAEGFMLKIPLVVNGPEIEIAGRFIFTLKDGSLTISWKLLNLARLIRDEFDANRARIEASTGLTVMLGQQSSR